MSEYLPLSAFRRDLMPERCRSCAWWQTTGSCPQSPEAAAERRRQWMTEVESSWGSAGLLLVDSSPRAASAPPALIASIGFAPANALPRLRTLSFGPLPEVSALLFCLTVADGRTRLQGKRVLHKALTQLKIRGIEEVYAVARPTTIFDDPAACRFFAADFLLASGFQMVAENGELVLMRLDLRGLLSLVDRLGTAVKRVLHNAPTPSPAAWSQRGT